jgi:Cytochrome P450
MVHVAMEHLIKIALKVGFTSHFFSSALSSDNGVSFGLNLALMLGGLWAICSELLVIVWRRKLPPGSLGVPMFGDIPLLMAYRGNLKQMWMDKRKEFGSTFLTNIPPLMIASLGDEQGVRWLWMNDRKQYTQVAWPPSIAKLIGPCALANASGAHHKEMRRIMEPFFAPTFVRNYMTVVDKTTQQELQKWVQPDFLASAIFKEYALRLFLAATFDHVDEESLHDLSNDMHTWLMGFITLSLDKRIPGMAFDRAMKARDRMLNRIDALVKIFAAKHSKDSEQAMNTIVGRMIYAVDDDGKTLTYQERQDNLLNLLFAGTCRVCKNLTFLFLLLTYTFLQAMTQPMRPFRRLFTTYQSTQTLKRRSYQKFLTSRFL